MAVNYKHLCEQMKSLVTRYQDEIVPGLRHVIKDLESHREAVVRCKKCRFADPYERIDGETGYYCMHQKHSFTYGQNLDRVFHPVKEGDDFCSYGQKKEASE